MTSVAYAEMDSTKTFVGEQYKFHNTFAFLRLECIPVGCVPPARYRMGGYPNKDPLDRDPPGQRPPGQSPLDRDPPGQRPRNRDSLWTETLWTETPLDRDPLTEIPSGQRPSGQRPPWTETPLDRDPPGQRTPDKDPPCHVTCVTDTCENITFANFVCGR